MTFDDHLSFCNALMDKPCWQTGGKPTRADFLQLMPYTAAFIPGIWPAAMRQYNTQQFTVGHIVTQDDLFRTWGMLGNPYSYAFRAIEYCKNGSVIKQDDFMRLLQDAKVRYPIRFVVRTPTYLEYGGIKITFNFAPCGETSLNNIVFRSNNFRRVKTYLEWRLELDSTIQMPYIPTMTAPIITVEVTSPLDSRPNIDDYAISLFTGYYLKYENDTDTIDNTVRSKNYHVVASTTTAQNGLYKIRRGTFTQASMYLDNTTSSTPTWSSVYDYHPDYQKPLFVEDPILRLTNDFKFKKCYFQYGVDNVFLIAPGDNASYGNIHIGGGDDF